MHKLILLFILGTVSLIAYSLYEPHTLRTKHYTIDCAALSGLKIVFAADFHIAPNDTNRLNKIITAIKNEQPDLIILGGDYVKGHQKSSAMPVRQIAQQLATLQTPLGIYAVIGNHDNWYGKKEVLDALTEYGIVVLDNSNHRLNINKHYLFLAGVSDMATDTPDLSAALANTSSPVILISHSPDIFPESPETTLTLAAHTHGGQINLPFLGAPIVPSKYGQRYNKGIIKENGKTMIVTQGLGTSILPIRFNCPPEIVIIKFD